MKILWRRLLTSKTVWLNAIAVAVAIVQLAQQQAWINPELQAGILGVLNLILRLLTNDALVTKGGAGK